jgi:hypothetical protein
MLTISLHAGSLEARNPSNHLAVLDIAYAKRHAFADYSVAMSLRGVGEVAPDKVLGYPRWSASVWDLTARALTRLLYRADQAPKSQTPDRRCAYATRMCAVIVRPTLDSLGAEIGWAEITQGKRRGHYQVELDEDILGPRSGSLAYGMKSLNPADLFLRAICAALYGGDVLGPKPNLIVPSSLPIDGDERFDVGSLQEPARTGFQRFRSLYPMAAAPEPLAKKTDYVNFLMGA